MLGVEETPRGEPWALLGGMAVFSIATSFLNKQVTAVCPDLFFVLLLQNGLGIIVALLVLPSWDKGWKPFRSLPREVYVKTFFLAWLFMAILWTSLLGLGKGSVSLSVVAKSCLPLLVAILEPLCLPESNNRRVLFWVSLMAIVAVWLGSLDPTATYEVVLIFLLNLILAAALSVIERMLVKSYTGVVSASQLGTLRNAWSVPISLLFMLLLAEDTSVLVASVTNVPALFWIGLSAVFANALSLTGFVLKSLTTATTLAVVGTASKIISILMDTIWTIGQGGRSMPPELWVSMGLFSFFISMYAWETTKKAPHTGDPLPERTNASKGTAAALVIGSCTYLAFALSTLSG